MNLLEIFISPNISVLIFDQSFIFTVPSKFPTNAINILTSNYVKKKNEKKERKKIQTIQSSILGKIKKKNFSRYREQWSPRIPDFHFLDDDTTREPHVRNACTRKPPLLWARQTVKRIGNFILTAAEGATWKTLVSQRWLQRLEGRAHEANVT